MIVPVILAGGSGTRLWPLSREAYPKQFISLVDGQSLFQQTLSRVSHLPQCAKPIVVGNEQHRFLMAEQIRQSQMKECTILLEPSFKGTAPAVALAAIQAVAHNNNDALLLVLPADHVISDLEGFLRTVLIGKESAKSGKLVTFGVVPTAPETGYGYIQKGACLGKTFEIANFVEKPNQQTAKRYVESQNYYWNSGMFLFSAAAFLQELLLHAPEIYHAAKSAYSDGKQCEDFIRPNATEFQLCPINSLDYAVMEKTSNAVVVPLESPWNDVGAWDAISDLFSKDDAGNSCTGDVIVKHCEDSLVQSHHRLVVSIGMKNVVIIETPDAVLVMDKAHSQEIKPVICAMREAARKEVHFHRRVNRPWGAFESIDGGERFQVKRITVAIGERLSLQRHHHRSEHWVVVKGTARVTRGEEIFLLSENQSTYIPTGVNHRLENVGKIPLEIIEVQSGSYLGEDDIVRLEDQYGRTEKLKRDVVTSI